MTHFVYFIQRPDGCLKIGVSKHPEKRIKELQTGSNQALKRVASFPFKTGKEAFRMEKELHEHFAPFRQEGEWFHKGLLKDITKNMIRKRETFLLLRENIRRNVISRDGLVDAGVLEHAPERGITWENDLAKQRQTRLKLKYEQKYKIRDRQKAEHQKVMDACKAAGISTAGLPDHLLVKKLNGETI